jgi:hypothetical protein
MAVLLRLEEIETLLRFRFDSIYPPQGLIMQLLNPRRRFDSSDILPLFALGTLGLQVLILLLVFGNMYNTWSMAHKPAPSMVQLVDGKSVAMEPVDHLARTPEDVRRFVKDTMALMFTWSSKIASNGDTANTPTNNPATVIDPGVPLQNGKVTTASWQSSFALKEDFRTQFLNEVAKMTPATVFGSGAQSVLSFESVSDPKPLKTGTWQVDVVANLLIFDTAHPQGLAIPFDKSIFVSAVEPTTNPLPDNSTPIQKALYRVQENGLQITEIQDLDIQHIGQTNN